MTGRRCCMFVSVLAARLSQLRVLLNYGQLVNQGASPRGAPFACLAPVRHGQSEFNSPNLFTVCSVIDLTDLGITQARTAGLKLKAASASTSFTSTLKRALRTFDFMMADIVQTGFPVIRDRLNERDYAICGLTDARSAARAVHVSSLLRRAPPVGKSLKDNAALVLRYYLQEILPRVMRGERMLVSEPGNSLRALVMVLELATNASAFLKRSIVHRRAQMIFRPQRRLHGPDRLRSLHRAALNLTPPLRRPPSRSSRACGLRPSDSR